MAITQGPRVAYDMEAASGLPHSGNNPPSKLWCLLGPLGCYIGILKARQAGTSTTFFRRAAYVTGGVLVLWLLMAVVAMIMVGRLNDEIDRDTIGVSPAVVDSPRPLVLPQGGERYVVFGVAGEDPDLFSIAGTLRHRLDDRGLVVCGGEQIFVVLHDAATLEDEALFAGLPLEISLIDSKPVRTDGLSASC
jgi:hypothetical protein